MTRQISLRLPSLPPREIALLEEGRHPDPFAVLGRHAVEDITLVRAFLPGAHYVELVTGEGEERHSAAMIAEGNGLFEAPCPSDQPYRLRIAWPGGFAEAADPYSFGLLLSDDDIYLFAEGRHFDLSTRLGANPRRIDGIDGVLFAVWAPNASHVAVVGDFNGWDERRHPMRRRLGPGVWELFIPGVAPGAVYKYALASRLGRAPALEGRSAGAPHRGAAPHRLRRRRCRPTSPGRDADVAGPPQPRQPGGGADGRL